MHDPPFVQVLGAVRFVTDDGESITLPSASQRRLLALLALGAGTTLRSEHLCDLLEVSTGALRTTVSRVRRRLGEHVVVTDAVGYRIGCPVDSALFARAVIAPADQGDRLVDLEAALSLWHGDALDEFRHEPWAEAEATRLDELRCLATEERFECLLRRGRSGEVVAELESYLSTHPLRDRPWGLLMEALADQGRRGDALRRYQEYRTLLEQCGLEPSAAVRSVEQRIAVGHGDRPAPDRRAEPGGTDTTAVQVPLPAAVRLSARSIGRYRELATLSQELGVARRGRLRTVVMSGEAGIGKTTVLATFARSHQGRHGATVLYGRCEDGGDVPLQPLRSIIEASVDHAPLPMLRAHCERFGGELQRVAPRLLTRLWVPRPLTADDAIERHHLFAAITDLLRRMTTTGPVALLLDDLHWAEPTALMLVRHLADELSDAPVLLVVSYRDVGPGPSPALRATLSDLDCIDATRLRLHGLEDDGLAAIVSAAARTEVPLGDDVLDRLRDQTAGNPLYASHLTRHLAEIGALAVDGDTLRLTRPLDDTGLPDSLVEVVGSRVLSLGSTAQTVLRAAAVLGVEFDQRVLLAMSDLSDDELATVLDSAVDAGLLIEGDRTACSMRFTHALVARALSAEIGAPGRRRLHERAVNALLSTSARTSSPGATDEMPVATVVALARHAESAGDLAAAQHWAATAGDRYLDHLAAAEAAGWYSTALE
ncbi:MAG: AAA family ATPase, partial [Actinomycetota bacterium]|nr:AAA family ATPase [Actinomycetota bacterium]